MQSAFIATCPNSNEAVIVVLGVTTVSEFRAAAAAQGLIRTCDDEEGYEFYKPLQAWAVLTPEGTWDLGASSDAPDALPAMVATARWVSITSCQCEACPVKDGTHQPAEALHQIAEPDALDIRELAAKLAFELECMLIDPHEHWDSEAKALDAYKQAQGPSPSPFATDAPIPPERKAIYAALRAKREAEQAKQGGAA